MKFRSTWLVLLVVLGLVGVVWWFEWRDSSARNGRNGSLLPFAADSLASIEVQHSGERFYLTRRNRGWVLVSPIEAPCDTAVVNNLLALLEGARVEQNVGGGDDQRYGLQTPSSTMVITHQRGAISTLQFGRINPLQTLVYVKRDDSNDVLLTTSELLTISLNTAFGWRDKRIVDVPINAVHRVRLRTLIAGELTVERGENDLWYVQGDSRWRVDPLRMQNLLLMLAQMQAVGVSAEAKMSLEKFGLDRRGLSAYLEDEKGGILADVILGWNKGDGSNHVIVPDKPEIFRVGGDLGEIITAFTADSRDRKVFPPFDLRAVTRIEVDSAIDAFAVEHKSITRWGVVYSSHHDTTFVVDAVRIQETLESLHALQLDEFPKNRPLKSSYEPAEMTVRLLGANGLLSGVQVGRKDPNGFLTFVRGIDEPEVVLLSPGRLIEMPFDLSRLGHEKVDVVEPED